MAARRLRKFKHLNHYEEFVTVRNLIQALLQLETHHD
jgi:hypothetical protein